MTLKGRLGYKPPLQQSLEVWGLVIGYRLMIMFREFI